jgi:hypothetical protein
MSEPAISGSGETGDTGDTGGGGGTGGGGTGGGGLGNVGKGWAYFLLALAVLLIVLAVIVSVISDKNWSKITTFILTIFGLIFGGAGTTRLYSAARQEGYRAATMR